MKKPIQANEIPAFKKWLIEVKRVQMLQPLQPNEVLRFKHQGKVGVVHTIKDGKALGELPRIVMTLAREYAHLRDIDQLYQEPTIQVDVQKLLGTFTDLSKFARWLEHCGATILMADIAKNEILAFRWSNDGVQVTDYVWCKLSGNRVSCTESTIKLLESYQVHRSLPLGGATPRLKVQNATVAALIKRDGHACIYCGKSAAEAKTLTIEHFIPISHGGTNHLDNLGFACLPCNRAAGNLSVAEKIRIRDAIRGAKECAA